VSEEREHPVRIPSGEGDPEGEREIRFLRSVLELLPVGVFWKDRRGRYGGCNAAFLEYVGCSREELIGRTVEEVHPEELARVYRSQDELLMREGRGVQIYRFMARRAASEELRDVDFYKAPLRDESGEVAGLVGAMVDVTDQVRAQEERLVLAERAMENRRLESLGVLAGGIAHDLNNLLLCISGNLELALEEAAGREYLRERLLDALEATRRTADLTRQILISAGRGSFRARVVDLWEIVRSIEGLLTVLVGERARLTLESDSPRPPIRGDESLIRQILLDLVRNAAEALPGGEGSVRVSVGLRWAGEEILRTSRLPPPPPGAFVELAVRDDGCGMDEETGRRLFDPFWSTKFPGRGLGLAAVAGVVRSHGGAILLESERNRGTTIRVLFPAAPEEDQGVPGEEG